MKIRKILNNNFVIVGENLDKIVMGIGIGYKKKIGDLLDERLVDKTFYLTDSDLSLRFVELLSSTSVEVIRIVDDVVVKAKTNGMEPISDGIYLALIDHIQSAINFHKMGKKINNALLWDIEHLYNEEFKIGQHAIEMINTAFNIDMPLDEAGFIALHIVNSTLSENNSAYETTQIIKSILTIIKYHFRIVFNEESLVYNRLITHLRFFTKRILAKNKTNNLLNKTLFESTKNEFRNSFECATTIKGFIKKQYDYEMDDNELLYLMIHIERAINDLQTIERKDNE
ncbi:MAG: PRD domain-containing protein [Erysipelotrichaceae bacterium]|nr:PRD domain-containing protein [Erysipelotrichaceae bacterium]